MNSYEQAFKLLGKLGIVDLIRNNSDGAKSTVAGMMDLNFDLLSFDGKVARIALSHYGTMNGDAMADPDMELRVFFHEEGGSVEALHYQNDYVHTFQRVYQCNAEGVEVAVNLKLKKQLISFLNTWMRNAIAQGHSFVGA